LIIIAYIKFNSNTNKYLKSSIVSIIFLVIFFSLNIFVSKTTTYLNEEVNYNQGLTLDSLDNFEVKYHYIQANINSKSNFKNKIILINQSKTSQSQIDLLLDEIFNVEYVRVNGNPVLFNHKDNLLTLNLENSINPKDKLTIDIKYSGYINIQTSWNEYLYIATKNEIMLPIDSLAWFPKVNQSSNINYNLSINSNKHIYSNLDIESSKRNFMSTTYNFSGNVPDVALYSGDYKTSTINGVNLVYAADSNPKQSFDTWYNKVLSSTEYLSNEKNQIDRAFKNKEIKKIIISRLAPHTKLIKDEHGNASQFYLEQLLLNDTLIINKFN